MRAKHGLGRGLDALLANGSASAQAVEGTVIRTVPVDRVRRNARQPRQRFDEEALAELAASIRERGVLQPLLVREVQDGYELIAGERRLRAAGAAGLSQVPVIVMQATDTESLELALVENLQRENLNAIEEAEGYHALVADFSLTQDEIATRVGKARATVANALRLLTLPDEVRDALADGRLTPGHAKAVLGLETAQEQIQCARRALSEGLSVRQTERVVQKSRRTSRAAREPQADLPPAHLADLTDRLHRHFGTHVRLTPSRVLVNGRRARGTLEIDFYSNDDLHRILELLGLSEP